MADIHTQGKESMKKANKPMSSRISDKGGLLGMILGATLGMVLGGSAVYIASPLLSSNTQTNTSAENDENKPLYWVAPMDDNYRRDKPGLSPMGMDLVPVYADDNQSQSGEKSSAGAVRISANVVNNLGVRTAPVLLSAFKNEIATVGYVQYDEDKLVHIHPRVEGWIETLFVKAAGNPVQKGEPLYTLYSPQLVNAQEELLLALKRNNKPLIKAAKARLSALQLSPSFINNLEKSRKVTQSITFNAPTSGVVDGLKIREGFYVKPGTTIMSIGELEHVWVTAEVFERDVALVKLNQSVTMSLDYLPGRQWQGVVDYIYPTLDAKNRTLRVRLKFENRDYALKPNMFAQINIHSQPTEQVLLVPKEAVIRTGKQNRVVVSLGDGYFKSVEVSLGRVSSEHIEILSGVTQSDTVVTSAQFLIDSESSKSSDFLRMEAIESSSMSMSDSSSMPIDASIPSATVRGLVNAIDSDNRIINISREAIEKWDRGPATMDFYVDETIDFSDITASMTIEFTFEVREELTIVAFSPVTDTVE